MEALIGLNGGLPEDLLVGRKRVRVTGLAAARALDAPGEVLHPYTLWPIDYLFITLFRSITADFRIIEDSLSSVTRSAVVAILIVLGLLSSLKYEAMMVLLFLVISRNSPFLGS